MTDELMTQIDYAKRMGVSRQYISELVQKRRG
jgi:transcriptional regulator with XRE-family HTH domain